jgi:O-antigen ligase
MRALYPSAWLGGPLADRRIAWAIPAAALAGTAVWLLPSVQQIILFGGAAAVAFAMLPLLWREGYTWAILWLAPLANLEQFPTVGVRVAKYALIALAVAIAVSKRRIARPAPSTWPTRPLYLVLALFAWIWTSALTGGAPLAGALEAARLSAVAFVAYLWLSEPGRAGGRRRWYVLWMIMGLYQVAACTLEAVLLSSVRSYGTLSNANALGTYLIATVALAAAAAIRAPSRRARAASRLVLVALLFALYLTGSRSAWLAVALTLVVMAIAARRWLVLAGAASIMAAALYVYVSNPVVRFTVDAALRLEGGLTHRPILWDAADRAWSHAWLIGYGLEAGGEQMEAEARYPTPVHRHLAAEIVQAGSPHNFYREMLLETGVVGLVLLLAAVFAVWRSGWRARRSPDGWRAVYALAFCSVTAGYMVHSYFERSVLLGSMSSAVFYWFLATQALRADDPPFAAGPQARAEVMAT